MPYLLSIVSTRDCASATDAPGTITMRQASYEALSTTCRIMLTRVNSIEAITKKKSTIATIANSTAVAPRRIPVNLFELFELRIALRLIFMRAVASWLPIWSRVSEGCGQYLEKLLISHLPSWHGSVCRHQWPPPLACAKFLLR